RLALRHAFHSRLLEPMLDELERAAGRVAFQPPLLPVVGNLTGEVVLSYDAAYWRAQARAPVRFTEGLLRLQELGCTHLIELGAQPVLSSFARPQFREAPTLPARPRPRPGASEPPAEANWRTLLEALAQLWQDGAPIDWAAH